MKKLLLPFVFCLGWLAALSGQNLVSATFVAQRTKAQIATSTGVPFVQYGAKYYRVKYTTPDVHGVLDTASGLLVVPNDPTKVFPRLVYQHGTSDCKTCVPSFYGSSGGEEGLVGLLFGGMGYVALLPDYLGMGSARGFQTYVHAASEASAAVDMLRASDEFVAQNNVAINDQLFVTGYSQGGHGAMALVRDLENNLTDEFTLTASAPLSGPYSLTGAMRNLILSETAYGYPAYIPNTTLGFQEAYGNIYTQLTDIFKPDYVAPIQNYRNGTIGLTALNNQLIQKLNTLTGSVVARRMLKDSIVALIETDPTQPINVALADNDTYNNWDPVAPLRLFYCTADDQVPYQNSLIARDSILLTNPTNFQVTDVSPTADHGACYNPAMTQTLLFFAGFQQITTDASEPLALPSLSIKNNPARDFCVLENGGGAAQLFVTDANGRLVLTDDCPANSSFRLNVQNLPTGIYTVQLAGNEGIRTTRLMVQR